METSDPLRLALFQPDIAANTGAVLRLAACLDLPVDIIEPCGFPFDLRRMRRAGLDYLDHVSVERHASFAEFERVRRGTGRRLVLLTTRAQVDHIDFDFRPGDTLMAGSESAGAPQAVHEAADARVRIPMRPGMRALNVTTALACAAGEALTRLGAWPGRRVDASLAAIP